jgi:hypothetical protein
MRGFQPFLFGLKSMQSTISAKSSQPYGDKVSLSDRPWMSSYIMQCVSWLWTVFWPSSDHFPGELKWRWARYSILQAWSAIAILHGDLEQIAEYRPPGVQVNVHGAKAEIPSWQGTKGGSWGGHTASKCIGCCHEFIALYYPGKELQIALASS